MHLLPQSIRDMIDIIGTTAALALVRAYAGRMLKVPQGITEGKTKARLSSLMGAEATEKFIQHYGGQTLAIPRCLAVLLAQRNAAIIASFDRGVSAPRLAEEHTLTTRQIFKILKKTPEDNALDVQPDRHNSQISLFN